MKIMHRKPSVGGREWFGNLGNDDQSRTRKVPSVLSRRSTGTTKSQKNIRQERILARRRRRILARRRREGIPASRESVLTT
jgi:hypothetical protein